MVNESFKESREDSNIEILSQIIKVFTDGVTNNKNGKSEIDPKIIEANGKFMGDLSKSLREFELKETELKENIVHS